MIYDIDVVFIVPYTLIVLLHQQYTACNKIASDLLIPLYEIFVLPSSVRSKSASAGWLYKNKIMVVIVLVVVQ